MNVTLSINPDRLSEKVVGCFCKASFWKTRHGTWNRFCGGEGAELVVVAAIGTAGGWEGLEKMPGEYQRRGGPLPRRGNK